MAEPLPEVKIDTTSVDGLEVLFDKDCPVSSSPVEGQSFKRGTVQEGSKPQPFSSGNVQDQTTADTSSVQHGPRDLIQPITVDEAARLLNISTNAVCKRLRKGSLIGQKIPGKFKDEWLVEGTGLASVLKIDIELIEDGPETAPAKQGTVLDQTTRDGSVQNDPESGSAKSGNVQDQTTVSARSVVNSPESVVRLVDLVEKQAAKLEAAAGQIGYLQAQLESQSRLLEIRDEQIKLLTDSQNKATLWSRLYSWLASKGG